MMQIFWTLLNTSTSAPIFTGCSLPIDVIPFPLICINPDIDIISIIKNSLNNLCGYIQELIDIIKNILINPGSQSLGVVGVIILFTIIVVSLGLTILAMLRPNKSKWTVPGMPNDISDQMRDKLERIAKGVPERGQLIPLQGPPVRLGGLPTIPVSKPAGFDLWTAEQKQAWIIREKQELNIKYGNVELRLIPNSRPRFPAPVSVEAPIVPSPPTSAEIPFPDPGLKKK